MVYETVMEQSRESFGLSKVQRQHLITLRSTKWASEGTEEV
jgi:hypothetical protein